mmetsp:Transcript_27808/g.65347  ORF Transcript_27808/g.65347 Transcript_27808/m.65347 type:complete len:305 (+) Transcript_27808:282-1196(+)
MAANSTSITPMTLTEARDEVKKCEQEIQSIKVALRGIGSVNSSEQNSLEIEFTKVEGLPESAKPTLKLQLSSPIEERDLTLEGEKASFAGVETSLAMLTIEAKDADIPLGASKTPIEVAPFCSLDDPKQPKEEYVTEVSVPIVAEEETTTEEQTETAPAAKPTVCTVTLRVTYKPSPKDQREELCELLNKTSQRKATALGALRKLSIERVRAGAAASDSASEGKTLAKPSVKPGFLNKGGPSEKEEEKGFLSAAKQWYQRVISPDSIVMRTAFFAIVTKDFWIFFGAVGLMHYRGNLLALPPPV